MNETKIPSFARRLIHLIDPRASQHRCDRAVNNRHATWTVAFQWGIAVLPISLLSLGCNPSPTEQTSSETATSAGQASVSQIEAVANAAVASQDWVNAEKQVLKLLAVAPHDQRYLTLGAMVYGRQNKRREAAELLADATDHPDSAASLRPLTLRAFIDAGMLFDAIEWLDRQVASHPEDVFLRRTLVGFLGEAQMPHRIPPHLGRLIQRRQFDAPLLATVLLPGRRFATESLDVLRDRNPHDRRLRIGEAANAIDQARYDDAIELLRSILENHPKFDPAAALLARALAITRDFPRLETLLSKHPTHSVEDPQWRLARGRMRYASGDVAGSLMDLWPAANELCNDPVALDWLDESLRALPPRSVRGSEDLRNAAIASIAQRQSRLAALLTDASDLQHRSYDDPEATVRVAEQMLRLGRLWEAEGWSAIALQKLSSDSSSSTWRMEAERVRGECLNRLSSGTAWQQPVAHLLPPPADLMEHVRKLAAGSTSVSDSTTTTGYRRGEVPPLRFVDVTDPLRLRVEAQTSDQRFGPSVPLSDSLGCGVGTFDYDLDGRPDLYFAAAGNDPGGGGNEPSSLWRNLGRRFGEATIPSGTGDRGFGQGVAMADVDQDGFTDLLVLNFGPNRAYRNNGDGTFSDVTTDWNLDGGPHWSSSAAWIDLDGDGMLECVVCNYIEASPDVTRPCLHPDGSPAPCSPLDFPPQSNSLHRSDRHLRFRDVAPESGFRSDPGRSLGLLAGPLDDSGTTILFANDMTANEVYVAESDAKSSSVFPLVDRSFLSGLAVDGRGRTQASMGIATMDVDADGDVDLYVTGFSDEYHVVYSRQATAVRTEPATWRDRTAASNILDATLARVGFGVKALDFDHDGFDELIVSNGHVSGEASAEVPYAQPVDVFAHLGGGVFERISAIGGSDYFERPHVGRCVLPLDENGDGDVDLVITHVTEPPVLLRNQSPAKGRGHAILLVGRRGNRDAFGATVSIGLVRDGRRRQVNLHRHGGGGYLISPEPWLRFSVPNGWTIETAEIAWPGGLRQVLVPAHVGAATMIIEGMMPVSMND